MIKAFGVLAAAAAGLALASAAMPSWAGNPNYLTVVRTSASTMKVDFVFDAIDYHATLTSFGEDWNSPEQTGEIAGFATLDFSQLFSEGAFWIDPAASAGLAHLNIIPSGNRGTTSLDVNLNGSPPPFAAGGRCEVGGLSVSCPLLANGQTWVAPIRAEGPSGFIGSTIDVTFTDQTVVPEPAGWVLAIVGFGLAGSTLRRRRVLA